MDRNGPIKATHKLDKSLPKKKEHVLDSRETNGSEEMALLASADNAMYDASQQQLQYQDSENLTTLKHYTTRDELEPLDEKPDKKFRTAMDRL